MGDLSELHEREDKLQAWAPLLRQETKFLRGGQLC